MNEEDLFECIGLSARISPYQCRANRTRPISSSVSNVPTRPPACLSCSQWKDIDSPLPDAIDPAELALAETLSDLECDIEHGRLSIKYILFHYDSRVESALQKKRPQKMAEWCRFLGFKLLDGEEFRGVSRLTCLLVDRTVREFIDQRINSPVLQETPETLDAAERLANVFEAAREAFPTKQQPFEDANIFVVPEDDDFQDEEEPRIIPRDSPTSPPAAAPTPAKQSHPEPRSDAMKGCAEAGFPPSCPPGDAPCAECRFFRPLPTFHNGVPGVRLCWATCPEWGFICYQPRKGEAHAGRA